MRKKPIDFGMEQLNKRGVHELVVIRDVQADHPFAEKVWLEFVGQFGLVVPLHHEDQFRPLHELGSKRILSAMIQTGRGALDSRMLGKYLLGCRTTPPVHAADEENALQSLKRLNV